MIAAVTPGSSALVDFLVEVEAETMGVFEAASKLLETRFAALWAIYGEGVPVDWPNAPFRPAHPVRHVAFNILFGDGIQASIGPQPLEFQSGVLVFQIFDTKDGGSRASARIADNLSRLRHSQLSGHGVVVDVFVPRTVDVGERAAYFQRNVQLPFRAQHQPALED